MMVEFQVFLLFLGAALLVAITPGPERCSTLRHERLQAAVRMVWHRLGRRCWRFVHVIAGAVGISALVMASAEAFTLLKRVGTVYLIWLGSRHGPKPRSSTRSGWR